MIIDHGNNPQSVFDKHFALKCPHCGVHSNITAVSIPRFEYLTRFLPQKVGIAYRCDSCNSPIFLRFMAGYHELPSKVVLSEEYEEIERPTETFEFGYLPEPVSEDFREALTCYSHMCYNAFAAMCRRTVQSVCANMGAEGTDRVLNQLKDLKEMAEIDEETFSVLRQIVIEGHNGAHPHLPRLTPDRASVLLELMKDVLYQLYVRKGKLKEAMALRQKAIKDRQ